MPDEIEQKAIQRFQMLLMKYLKYFPHPPIGSFQEALLYSLLRFQANMQIIEEEEQA